MNSYLISVKVNKVGPMLGTLIKFGQGAYLMIFLFLTIHNNLNGQCQIVFSQCPVDQTVYVCDGQGQIYHTSYPPVSAYLNGNCVGLSLVIYQAFGPILPTNIPAGTYLIRYIAYAIDQNGAQTGLSAFCDFNLFVINDVTSPVFSYCPPNITINGVLDQDDNCTGVGYWQSPVVYDNCSNVTLSDGGSRCGSQFPIGTTNVIYTGMDQNGNTNTCSFTVTVICPNAIQHHLYETLLIYPSPVNDIISIELPVPASAGMKLQVTNMHGQVLIEKKTETGLVFQSMGIDQLPEGIYLVALISDKRSLSVNKFVKL